jgi:hypothetical protein
MAVREEAKMKIFFAAESCYATSALPTAESNGYPRHKRVQEKEGLLPTPQLVVLALLNLQCTEARSIRLPSSSWLGMSHGVAVSEELLVVDDIHAR